MFQLALEVTCSVTTLGSIWLYGGTWHPLVAPLLGVVANLFWVVFIVHTGAWGLIPLTIGAILTHAANTWRAYRRL